MSNDQPVPPQLVHDDQPDGERFWVREDLDYYASFPFQVMDGPLSKYTPVAGFNAENEAHHYAQALNQANAPESAE